MLMAMEGAPYSIARHSDLHVVSAHHQPSPIFFFRHLTAPPTQSPSSPSPHFNSTLHSPLPLSSPPSPTSSELFNLQFRPVSDRSVPHTSRHQHRFDAPSCFACEPKPRGLRPEAHNSYPSVEWIEWSTICSEIFAGSGQRFWGLKPIASVAKMLIKGPQMHQIGEQ